MLKLLNSINCNAAEVIDVTSAAWGTGSCDPASTSLSETQNREVLTSFHLLFEEFELKVDLSGVKISKVAISLGITIAYMEIHVLAPINV